MFRTVANTNNTLSPRAQLIPFLRVSSLPPSPHPLSFSIIPVSVALGVCVLQERSQKQSLRTRRRAMHKTVYISAGHVMYINIKCKNIRGIVRRLGDERSDIPYPYTRQTPTSASESQNDIYHIDAISRNGICHDSKVYEPQDSRTSGNRVPSRSSDLCLMSHIYFFFKFSPACSHLFNVEFSSLCDKKL